MSVHETIRLLVKVIVTVDKLLRIFGVFAIWRRKATVHGVFKTLHRAGHDPEVRAAICSVKHAKYVMDAIDSNAAHLKKFAQAYGALDGTLKKMLAVSKKAAIERKAVLERL